MEKRVLVINLQAYNSLLSSNMRMYAMMKGLDELGYKMDLLCAPVSAVTHINDMSDYEFLDNVSIITTAQNTSYERLITGSEKNKSIKRIILPLLRKVYHKFSLYTGSANIARKLTLDILHQKEYKYVISVSDPKISQIALLTLLNRGLKAERVIEYWGDPMTGDITQTAIYPEFIIKREERKFLRIADKIVYTSPFTLEMEQKLHPKYAQKMMYVPTANTFKKIYPETRNAKYVVGYYGNYNSSIRNILPLYQAFESLITKAKLFLVGDSDLSLESTENVEVRPRGVVKDLEEMTDLFVCILNSSGTQIPGKLYYSAATNRPILVILDGEQQEKMRTYLESFNRFKICPNNKEDIVNTIIEILNSNESFEPCKLLEPALIAKKIIE